MYVKTKSYFLPYKSIRLKFAIFFLELLSKIKKTETFIQEELIKGQ